MTSKPDSPSRRPVDRVAIIGTGLIGTSIAMAAARAGCTVRGWDIDAGVVARAAARSTLTACATAGEAVAGAHLVIVCTPIGVVAKSVANALHDAPGAIVADAASIKEHVVREARAGAAPPDLPRYVPSHPLRGRDPLPLERDPARESGPSRVRDRPLRCASDGDPRRSARGAGRRGREELRPGQTGATRARDQTDSPSRCRGPPSGDPRRARG